MPRLWPQFGVQVDDVSVMTIANICQDQFVDVVLQCLDMSIGPDKLANTCCGPPKFLLNCRASEALRMPSVDEAIPVNGPPQRPWLKI